MLKCEIGEKIGTIIEIDCDLREALNDVLNLIQGVHDALNRNDPFEGLVFRTVLMKTLEADPSVWAPVDEEDAE